MTPEDLAAGWEETANWLETRPNGVTWTGDGLDGAVVGIRDSAKALRKHLVPAWRDLLAELDRYRAASPQDLARPDGRRMSREDIGEMTDARGRRIVISEHPGGAVLITVTPHSGRHGRIDLTTQELRSEFITLVNRVLDGGVQ